MLRFLWFLLIGFLILKLLRPLRRWFFPAATPRNDAGGGAGEELVKDPQCGVYFPKSLGVSAEKGGKVYYFCSPACRDAFLKKK